MTVPADQLQRFPVQQKTAVSAFDFAHSELNRNGISGNDDTCGVQFRRFRRPEFDPGNPADRFRRARMKRNLLRLRRSIEPDFRSHLLRNLSAERKTNPDRSCFQVLRNKLRAVDPACGKSGQRNVAVNSAVCVKIIICMEKRSRSRIRTVVRHNHQLVPPPRSRIKNGSVRRIRQFRMPDSLPVPVNIRTQTNRFQIQADRSSAFDETAVDARPALPGIFCQCIETPGNRDAFRKRKLRKIDLFRSLH